MHWLLSCSLLVPGVVLERRRSGALRARAGASGFFGVGFFAGNGGFLWVNREHYPKSPLNGRVAPA